MNANNKGLLFGLFAFLLFSLSDASVKMIHGGIPPIESAFFGAVIGFILLPFLVRHPMRSGYVKIFSTPNRGLWWLRFLVYPMSIIGSVTAFTHLSMSESMAIIFLQPTFVTIMSKLFLRESISKRQLISMILGLIGVLVALRPGFHSLSIGHLGAVLAGLGGGILIIIFRKIGQHETELSLVGAGLVGGIVVCGVLSLDHFVMPTINTIVYLFFYGFLAMLANMLIQIASTFTNAVLVGLTQYSQMIWAILLDYFIFKTHEDYLTFLGVFFILLSGAIVVPIESKRHYLPSVVLSLFAHAYHSVKKTKKRMWKLFHE